VIGTTKTLLPIVDEDGLMIGEIPVDFSNQCSICVHYTSNLSCRAFPKQIPAQIREGKVDHSKPYPGDNGIRFFPMNVKEQ